MNYRCAGVVDCAAVAVYASGQVDVFGVHEVSRVEQPGCAQRLCAQEHEAAVVVRRVDDLCRVAVGEVVPAAA